MFDDYALTRISHNATYRLQQKQGSEDDDDVIRASGGVRLLRARHSNDATNDSITMYKIFLLADNFVIAQQTRAGDMHYRMTDAYGMLLYDLECASTYGPCATQFVTLTRPPPES